MNGIIQHYTIFISWSVSYYYSAADFSLNVWYALICVHVNFIYFTLQSVFLLVVIIRTLVVQSFHN